MAEVAILGYGNVGWGVANVLTTNNELIAKRAGERVAMKYIFDKRDFPGDVHEDLITHDIEQIFNDSDVSVIVEALGGTDPAFMFAERALQAGKTYITSNKELVAAHGAALLKIAKDKNTSFLFEASVGGGMPIIRPLTDCLTADDILEVSGILNGTTNYILSKMHTEGTGFEEALADAQKIGYAESNPSADIDGHDAARKIAILLSIIVGRTVDYRDIPTVGIRDISSREIRCAKNAGYTIKLIARAVNTMDGFTASVAPMLVKDDILASVSGALNCMLVRGNAVGRLHFIGSGAGKLPTASAIISDIIDSIKHPGFNHNLFWSGDGYKLAGDWNEPQQRMIIIDNPQSDVLKKVNEVYSPQMIIESEDTASLGFITRPMSRQELSRNASTLGLYGIEIASQISII